MSNGKINKYEIVKYNKYKLQDCYVIPFIINVVKSDCVGIYLVIIMCI